MITLIGYRGCGKSTVAPRLAEAIGWSWIDADEELERRAGRTIREIFASDGETTFRDLEQAVITDLSSRPRLVAAAGGGVILRPANREILRSAGPVVWLEAPVALLHARIHGDPTTAARRPNLTTFGGLAEIESMLAAREPLYRETATIVIDAGERSPDDIVTEIVRRLPDDIASRGPTRNAAPATGGSRP